MISELDALQPLRDVGSEVLTTNGYPGNYFQIGDYVLPFTLNNINLSLEEYSDISRENMQDYLNSVLEGMSSRNDAQRLVVLQTTMSTNAFSEFSPRLPAGTTTIHDDAARTALRTKPEDPLPLMYMLNKRICIVTQKAGPALWLKLIAMLLYFDPKLLDGAPYPIDRKVFNALANNKFDAWVRIMLEWGTPLLANILEDRRRRNIKEIFSSINSNVQSVHEFNLRKTRDHLREIMEQYQAYLGQEANTLSLMRDYILHGRDMSETIDYWSTKKELTAITRASDTTIQLSITTPLTNFDLDELLQYMDSPRENDFNKSPKRKKFYTRLFIERTHTLWFTMDVRINTLDLTFEKKDVQIRTDSIAIPNEHLQKYNCWGNNKAIISRLLKEQNYEMLIEQVISSVANLNFSDPTVIGSFWQKMENDSTYHNTRAITINATEQRITIRKFMEECNEAD
jgi:hypothetical protein